MTRLFVYEYFCAGGPGRTGSGPAFLPKGRAMRDAVAADLGRVPGVEVTTLDADPAGEAESRFRELAAAADWTVVIAPECGGELERRTAAVVAAGGRLLGPSPAAVALAADKLTLAERWAAAGVPTPPTADANGGKPAGFPVVVKPRDGAGSEHVRRCDTLGEFEQFRGELQAAGFTRPLVVQPFVPGLAASVAFLIGPGHVVALAPTFQHLSADSRFAYHGGELPIPADLAARAVAVGRRAVAAVAGLLGYVAVDLILGPAADGSADVTVELNPRVSVSYVGLRALADGNLGDAMLRVAAGEVVPAPRWRTGGVRFRADGQVEWVEPR